MSKKVINSQLHKIKEYDNSGKFVINKEKNPLSVKNIPYMKCPKCQGNEFSVTEYQILGHWLGKIRTDGKENKEITAQSNLIGCSAITAICCRCHHSINSFNESWEGLLEKLKLIAEIGE